MANLTGESESDFDRRLTARFRRLCGDLRCWASLVAIGMTVMRSDVLADARTVKNGRHVIGRVVSAVGIGRQR